MENIDEPYNICKEQLYFLTWVSQNSEKLQLDVNMKSTIKIAIEHELYSDRMKSVLQMVRNQHLDQYLYYVQSVRGIKKPHNQQRELSRKRQKQRIGKTK